ncbi:related to proline oxidase [Rhynchosporium agropyri]|uniref:Proline dehydrogenase n=1 Tax=Rhynchosporium agropyri TaxID=914238 RepID=A0A1E1KXQ0_9HELO|nr:related to proline oxidase [Rhynchosporium agropyri]
MSKLANSKSSILSPDHNPLLRFFLKRTFYKQFCAGETSAEVKQTVDGLRNLGFSGVILAYAREVVLDKKQTEALASSGNDEAAEACIRNEIIPWKKGTLETVRLTRAGDYVGLKFTGAGSQALYDLSKQADPSPALKEAIDSVCDLALERGVKLLFDAEQTALQPGIDAWTLKYMEKYNKTEAVIYGTYQAYLKSCPTIVASHLEVARKGGFTLGVKLVRGAYLGSDPRHLICDTKADTDAAYDGISEALVRKSYNSILKPSSPHNDQTETPPFPNVSIVLAGHNLLSVRKVQAICSAQKASGEKEADVIYAQLQGMADEVSCELVLAGQQALAKGGEKAGLDVPKAYKYLVWGTTGECMKYLYRRAQENKDAVGRTREGRDAMARELWRRVKGAFGSA